MASPVFVITIDTEGDNIWARPGRVTTENARFIPRFQSACRDHGFKPTYLTNFEMVIEPRFQEFGRSVLKRGEAEIGLHIHPWNSPPLAPGSSDSRPDHNYLFELPDDLLRAKIQHQTKLLTDEFEARPTSHRAGRWGFDGRVARALVEEGYLVDCSVTPGVSWKRHIGARDGGGGTDYFGFPSQPYFLDLSDIRSPGRSPMLEVPMTIRSNYRLPIQRLHHAFEVRRVGKLVRRACGPPFSWLRPNGKNLDAMLSVVDWAIERKAAVLEFMLHSSELMPGGSPTFKTAEQIEILYSHLKQLFAYIASRGVGGQTLSEFRAAWSR